MMKVIFDLDGTLCDISHRLHYIKGKKKDYDAFHAACVDDAPKPEIIKIFHALRNDRHKIEVWSDRSDVVYTDTKKWLIKHLKSGFYTPYDLVLKMRSDGDYTPDQELKRYWLHGLDEKPDLVFDDRQRVVDMWREEGITCCQVDAWEE